MTIAVTPTERLSGAKIRARRLEIGMKQGELARRLGWTQSRLCRLENDQIQRLDPNELPRLKRVLKVRSIQHFFASD